MDLARRAVVGILSDFRYSARSFTRTPGHALTLLLTIALGIGSNAAVFGFVRGMLTRDLPLIGRDRVVSLFARDGHDAFGPVTYESYLAFRNQRDTFELLGAARESQGRITTGGRTSVLSVAAMTPEVADLLGLSQSEGVIIGHHAWRNELDSKASVQGERIRVDGLDTTVAAIAPDWLEGLYAGRPIDIWSPLQEASLEEIDRRSHTFWALGRLRPGVSADQAQAAVNAGRSGSDLIAVLPYDGTSPETSAGLARIAKLLPAAAGVVFFVACGTVGTLLLSRAAARSRDTSIRVALGSGQGQLARQLLSDSALVAAAGGLSGGLLAALTVRILPALLFEQDAERLAFSPSLFGIVAVSAACAAITVVCGLLPLLETRHQDPATVLRREGAGPSKAMRRLRDGLVVAQMMGCCLLVTSATLLLAGFRHALQASFGQRLGKPILATVQARSGFDRSDLGLQYFHDAELAVQSLPGVTVTAWVGTPPGGQPAWQFMRIEPPGVPLREVVMDVAAFTPPGSLALVTLPPIRGRMFGGGDTPRSCRVALVNEEAAQDFFEGEAVGRRIEDPAGLRVEIVGVVATHQTGSDVAPPRPTIYYYAEQSGTPLGRVGPARFRVPGAREAGGILDANVVSPRYFAAVGLAPLAGSGFPEDPTPGSCRVGVINQEAAELYFGGKAVGGAVVDGAGRRTEIVGVVPSPRLRTWQRPPEPTIYLPMAQDFLPRMTLMLGMSEANEAMLTAVRRRLDSVPGGAAGASVTTLEAHLGRTALATERMATMLVGVLAAIALALGLLGLSGAMTDAARERRRELAVRIAFGAQRRDVIGEALGQGMRLAIAGIVPGMLGSLLVARWLARVIPSGGALTFGEWLIGPLVVAAAVAIASVLPGRRALSMDPLTMMREG
jgi:predicted permease